MIGNTDPLIRNTEPPLGVKNFKTLACKKKARSFNNRQRLYVLKYTIVIRNHTRPKEGWLVLGQCLCEGVTCNIAYHCVDLATCCLLGQSSRTGEISLMSRTCLKD
jgi:hypothetical protein